MKIFSPPTRTLALAIRALLLGAMVIAADARALHAQSDSMAASPVVVPRAVQWEMRATQTGTRYRIYVSVPERPPPPHGYPVLWLMDGDAYFAMAAAQFDTRADLLPSIVVGIGYGDASGIPVPDMRTRDFTPSPASQEDVALFRAVGRTPPPAGGAEEFYNFLMREVRPKLLARYAVDTSRFMLYGHSHGGLFATYVMLKHPEIFASYGIASPSLYWGNEFTRGLEENFRRFVETRGRMPNVTLMIGDDESTVTRVPAPPGVSELVMRRELDRRRMRQNVIEFADRLRQMPNANADNVHLVVFPDENHFSVVAPSLARALTLSLVDSVATGAKR